MDMPLPQFEKGQSNQRAFSKPSGGQQEHFLAIRQVSDELFEFVGPVDKAPFVDDFAKNKRVFLQSHFTLIRVTLNGVMDKCALVILKIAPRRPQGS
jgi:hypothetical protein